MQGKRHRDANYYKDYWKTFLFLIIAATIIGLGAELIKLANEVPPIKYRHFYQSIGY